MPFFLLLAIIHCLWAQETTGIQALPKNPEVLLAQPAEILFTLRLPRGSEPDLGGWKAKETQWNDFVLWDYKIITRHENDLSLCELTVFVVPFSLGEAQIPAIEIPTKSQDGRPLTTVKTPPVSLKVLDPTQGKEGTGELKDIKKPRKPRYFWENPWFWIPTLLLLGTSLLAGLYIWKKIKKRKETASLLAQRLLSPEEAFYKDIDRLDREGLLERGAYREFHFALSEIFRKYLSKRFNLETESLTSAQVLQLLHRERQNLGVEIGLVIELKANFELNDLVKFAKYNPSEIENEKVIAILKRFVEGHRPTPTQSAETSKPEVSLKVL